MAVTRKKISPEMMPTAEQKKEIRAAAAKAPVFDEDSPELTPEQLTEMAESAHRQRGIAEPTSGSCDQ